MTRRMTKWRDKLAGCRYVLLVAAAGLLLMLWPSGRSAGAKGGEGEEEQRVAALLARMEGVGRAEVLLSESGAVIVCEGGENASVRLRVTQAVRCYTGLGADDIEIFNME